MCRRRTRTTSLCVTLTSFVTSSVKLSKSPLRFKCVWERVSVRECVWERVSERECVCVYEECVHVTGMYAFIFIYFFTSPLVFVYLQFCMYECICLQVYIHTYIHADITLDVHTYIQASMSAHMHVYAPVISWMETKCINTYIHTYCHGW